MKTFSNLKLHNSQVLQDGIDFGQIHTDNLEDPELDLDKQDSIIITTDDLTINTYNKLKESWGAFNNPNDLDYFQDVFTSLDYLEMVLE